MTTQRRIIQELEFEAAFRALDSLRARWMVEQLAGLLLACPQLGPRIDGSTFRVLHTDLYEEFPALRLYYRFDDKALLSAGRGGVRPVAAMGTALAGV